jgi:hydrogenase nickel incorporation protein HypA/HybF
MHEFSLATNIIEIIRESVKEKNINRVTKVVLEIGELSGVEEAALDTALESLVPGTELANAVFEKIHIPGKAKCYACNTEYQLSDLFEICPECQRYEKEIISGKEFNILSIEIESI